MAEEKRQLKVFLCHASADKFAVREIYQRLKIETWIDPWLDVARILPGQHWTTVIQQSLAEADSVIIFISNNSINREGFVQREMNRAWDLSLEKPRNVIYLIPLRLEDCEVPFDLRERQWADYFGEKKDETHQALLQSLKLRYEQKLRVEADEQLRYKRQRHELELAEKARLEAEELARQKAAEEKAEREIAEKIAREKAEKVVAEKERLESEERMRQKAAKEKAEREVAEKLAREKAEKAAAKKMQIEAEEKIRQKAAKEKSERKAVEKIARGKAAQEYAIKLRLKFEELSKLFRVT